MAVGDENEGAKCMSTSVSRRQLLRYSGLTTVALAGCTGTESNDGTTTTEGDMETTTAETTTDETTTEPDVSLTVADTTVEEWTVSVPQAIIDASGWLVIHPEADGGGPNGGVVLAATQLSPGTHDDIDLALDTVPADPTTVYGMLHYDDPADGEFTFPQNGDPAVTKDGSPVISPFSIQAAGTITPSLSVTDQETDGSTLSIPAAEVDEPGWVVVHPEASDGGPNGGVVLGSRHLSPGRYADLQLSLSTMLSADQTVYGMLHYDDPEDGEFTFPADGDPPITRDGSPIVTPFEVTVTDGTTDTTETVEAVNSTFDPVRRSIEPGTTVEWVNEDSYGHDVTSATFHDTAEDWDFSAPLAGGGGSATYTFESEGIYEYYCTIHGEGTMCGAVLVGDVSLDADLPCEGGGGGLY